MKEMPVRRQNRKAYEKPVLRVIELAAEEVMGGGCKVVLGTPGLVSICGTVTPCITTGTS